MKFPNPIGLPFGDGRRAYLRLEDDGGYIVQLQIRGPYLWEMTDRTARQDASGAGSGDPELVAAFPDLIAQRDAALQYFLHGTKAARDVRDVIGPELLRLLGKDDPGPQ